MLSDVMSQDDLGSLQLKQQNGPHWGDVEAFIDFLGTYHISGNWDTMVGRCDVDKTHHGLHFGLGSCANRSKGEGKLKFPLILQSSET